MSAARRPDLVLVGPGRVGRALALAWKRAGWKVRAVAGPGARRLARSLGPGVSAHRLAGPAVVRGQGVVLALPDAALAEVAESLPPEAARGRVFVHTSGSAPDRLLDPLRHAGAAAGRMHPLYPFSGGPRDGLGLRGACFALSGDRKAKALGSKLARSLGGRVLRLPADGETAYHLSAVLASNLVVALAAQAALLGRSWGREPADALKALLPLLRGAVGQMEQRGLPAALTGPLVRGESGTVRGHLDLLRRQGPPELAEIYRLLSLAGLDLARQGGHLEAAQERSLKRLLGPGK